MPWRIKMASIDVVKHLVVLGRFAAERGQGASVGPIAGDDPRQRSPYLVSTSPGPSRKRAVAPEPGRGRFLPMGPLLRRPASP